MTTDSEARVIFIAVDHGAAPESQEPRRVAAGEVFGFSFFGFLISFF